MGLKNPLYLLIFPRLRTGHLFHSSVLPQVGEAVILVWNFVLYHRPSFSRSLCYRSIYCCCGFNMSLPRSKILFAIRHGKLIRIIEFSFWFFACSRKCRWYICQENRCAERSCEACYSTLPQSYPRELNFWHWEIIHWGFPSIHSSEEGAFLHGWKLSGKFQETIRSYYVYTGLINSLSHVFFLLFNFGTFPIKRNQFPHTFLSLLLRLYGTIERILHDYGHQNPELDVVVVL